MKVLVLIRGTDEDEGIDYDSNRYSKSSLAASVLWDLTVLVDNRPLLQDARVSDIVNGGYKVRKEQGRDEGGGQNFALPLQLLIY